MVSIDVTHAQTNMKTYNFLFNLQINFDVELITIKPSQLGSGFSSLPPFLNEIYSIILLLLVFSSAIELQFSSGQHQPLSLKII